MPAVVILILSLVIGVPLLIALIKLIKGYQEIRFINKLQKRGEIVTGQIEDVDIVTKSLGRGQMVYGKVDIAFQAQGFQYRLSQTISKDLARFFLKHQTEAKVLYLPEAPQSARLARPCADFLAIQDLILGMGIPWYLIGSGIAISLLIFYFVWLQATDDAFFYQMGFPSVDFRATLFLGVGLFLVAFGLLVFLPGLLVERHLTKKYLSR